MSGYSTGFEAFVDCFLLRGTYRQSHKVLYRAKTKGSTSNKDKIVLVGNSLERAIWRSLPAMLKSFGNEQSWLYENDGLPERFSIWVGGLVVDKAKILGETESLFPDSTASMFNDETVNNLRTSLEKAENCERRLRTFIKRYCESLAIKENIPYERGIAPYWEHLSANQASFLATANGTAEHDTAWEQLCRQACRQAYDLCCPHSTARQMQAWITAWQPNPKTSS